MDKLVLKNLKFRGLHGYFDEERVTGNDFEVDLTFYTSLQESALSDDLAKTIDYSEIQKIVESIMQGDSVKLIETLAYRIGSALSAAYTNISSLEVSIRKLNPPMNGETEYAEVTMKWPR